MTKRFDSIFESTYYTKSLEAIRKEKKDKKDELTDAEKDEIDKKNKYLQAQKIRKEMKQIEEEITRSQETWKNLSEILQLQRDKKTGIDSQVQSYMQIQRDVDRCQEELSVQKRVGFGLSDSRSDATRSASRSRRS